MLSKLPVLNIPRVLLTPVRAHGGLSPLEKFERLRQLCCTSDIAKKREEILRKCRPQVAESVDPCEDYQVELLDVRCKTAMVLGGASGIGFHTADSLLKAGAMRVIVGDVNQATGIEAVKKLCNSHGDCKAVFLMTDVVEPPSIEMAFKEVYNRYCQLDILINTFGIYNETPQCWDQMIRTNLMGCVRATLLGYKYMSKNPQDENYQGSVIVNVSSYGSIANVPSMPFFSAAANGIIGLTSSLGQEFHYAKSKVRCVTVCTACTDTDLLKNMSKKHYDPLWAGFSTAAMKCCTKQSPNIVGKAITTCAKSGTTGSVYVVKEGKYFRYRIPDYDKIIRQETVLV